MSSNKKLLFDTHAFLAFFNREEGSETIKNLLEMIQGGNVEGFVATITLAELAYIYARKTDTGTARLRVMQIISEKTGYPTDMLDLDLDLEADLGIDTVKQAEMFAAIRAAYDIPREDTLKLRDFPTLAHAIKFVYDRRPDLKQHAAAPAAPMPIAAPSPVAAPAAAPVRSCTRAGTRCAGPPCRWQSRSGW